LHTADTMPRPRGSLRSLHRPTLALIYGAVVCGPLILIAGTAKPGAQGPLVVLADVLGYLAISLLILQVAVSGRWRATTASFGLRSVLSLHRAAGIAVLGLVLLHVGVLVADDPSRLALLNSFTAPPRARAGMLALLALLGIATTSACRRSLRLDYELWRALHLTFTALAIAATFAHVVWVDAYMSLPTIRRAVLGLVLIAAMALFWTRVARRYATAIRPYVVEEVRLERGDAVTLQLRASGHRGLRFEPGQFAWLRTSECVYGMDEHPFTLSSGADEPERPAFTVKALGDFSASVATLSRGSKVLVDGAHGEGFDPSRSTDGLFLIAAGIGITPAMSVLRTVAGQNGSGPIELVYGSRYWQDVTFREELAELDRELPNLRIVHVLSRPTPNWPGEVGRIDGPLLRRSAPANVARWNALVCGPPALVQIAERTLLDLGMPPRAIQAEGFG
jgi:predicted ferric reductase